jgi:hypothetical protein
MSRKSVACMHAFGHCKKTRERVAYPMALAGWPGLMSSHIRASLVLLKNHEPDLWVLHLQPQPEYMPMHASPHTPVYMIDRVRTGCKGILY